MNACCTFRLLYVSQNLRVLHTRDSHLTSIPPAFWSSFSFVTQHINIDEQVSTMEWEGDQIPGQVYDDSPPCMGSQPTLTPTIHPSPIALSFSLCRAAFPSSTVSGMIESESHIIYGEMICVAYSNISVEHRQRANNANNWMQFGLN